MMRAPEKIPALLQNISKIFKRGTLFDTYPKPATARPMIKAIELGAAPQIKLPSSKIPIAAR